MWGHVVDPGGVSKYDLNYCVKLQWVGPTDPPCSAKRVSVHLCQLGDERHSSLEHLHVTKSFCPLDTGLPTYLKAAIATVIDCKR